MFKKKITSLYRNRKYPVFLEILPVFLFLGFSKAFNIFVATEVLMITSLFNIIVGYLYTKKFNLIPIITTVLAMIFGGLTILLHDPSFIKIKITIINLLFATILITGMIFKKNFLKLILHNQLKINNQGWKILNQIWIVFFIFLAILNEIVRHLVSTDMWVNFKVFGILSLTLLFSILQYPIIKKYELKFYDNNKRRTKP